MDVLRFDTVSQEGLLCASDKWVNDGLVPPVHFM